MALTTGSRLGPFEIVALLGVGGMGEVYRATDTNLKRQVAIKVLPAAVSSDPDRLARFQREAEVLAALNHPNIAHIHGLEKADGTIALVMELVEGPTLGERIEGLRAQGKGLPLEEALPIAKQIAEALEAAHEQGIVHRDLKPANIKVREDGTVKVLDFGLAKAMEPAGVMSPSMSMSPTITTPAMTQAGMILGTAAYMSPEQAAGKPVDKRSDLWAFGVVLLEMLTGRQVFDGETVSHVLAAVLKDEPDWTALPPGTPSAIRRVLRRCLEKDRRRRLADAADVRLEIDEALAGPSDLAVTARDASPTGSLSNVRVAWSVAVVMAAIAIVVAGLAIRLMSRTVPTAPETRVDIVTPPTTRPESFALSPDGRQLAFVANNGGESLLWLRSLEDGTLRAIKGTESARSPFWSPDSRSIGFLAGDGVKWLELSDGSIHLVSNASLAVGNGTWNRDGVLLLGQGSVRPLSRFSVVSKGAPVDATKLHAQEVGHEFPWFLPDGQHFLYHVRGAADVAGTYLGALGGAAPRRLFGADGEAVVAAGYVLFGRNGTLFAQKFDPVQFEATGALIKIAEPAAANASLGNAFLALSASVNGSVAFRATAASRRDLVWFDRAGIEIERISDADDFNNLELSPDGHRVAMRRTVDDKNQIWTLDFTRRIWTRITTGMAGSQPVWSSDGQRIAFAESGQDGKSVLVAKAVSASAPEEVVFTLPTIGKLESWSPDGRFLLYSSARNIWALPLQGERTPHAVVRTPFAATNSAFSPDGKWIAYESNESGRFEIYAQPFPGPGERVQISTTGGVQARWRRDAKELFYVGLNGGLMAVPLSAAGTAMQPGQARLLFTTRIPASLPGGSRQQYDVSPDGQRFLVTTASTDVVTPPITLILNWKPKS